MHALASPAAWIDRDLPCISQTGSVSEADYEALVLKLHEIQVGRRQRRAGGNSRQRRAPSKRSHQGSNLPG